MHYNYYLLSLNAQPKRKHCPCKPGSVSPERDVCHLSTPQVTPRLKHSTLRRSTRLWADNPLPTVYANLQPPDGTAPRSPAGWWALTPPSHPYPLKISSLTKSKRGRLFSSPGSSCHQLLALSPVERPMLPGLSSRVLLNTSGRPEHCFRGAKVRINIQ